MRIAESVLGEVGNVARSAAADVPPRTCLSSPLLNARSPDYSLCCFKTMSDFVVYEISASHDMMI